MPSFNGHCGRNSEDERSLSGAEVVKSDDRVRCIGVVCLLNSPSDLEWIIGPSSLIGNTEHYSRLAMQGRRTSQGL